MESDYFAKDLMFFQRIFDQLSGVIFDKTKVLVAVSGGPDSMLLSIVLYEFFLKNKFDINNLFFIHCNHKTRPETDQEEEFIRDFFQKLNLYISTYHGQSKTENVLRERRYAEFNKIISQHGIDFLVTGHNLTDRIESSFMNMCRGAGLNGFLSMKFLDQNNLVQFAKILRPLLSLPKKEIESFCETFKIPFVVDYTNFNQDTSLRNKIRLSILPQFVCMSNKNKNGSCTFYESMEQVYQQLDKLYSVSDIGEFIPCQKSPYRNCDFCFVWDIPFGFIDEAVLLQVFKKFNIYTDISKNTISDFLQFFGQAGQGYKYLNGIYFFISNGKIYIVKAKQDFWKKYIEKSLIIDKLGEVDLGYEKVKITDKDWIGCELRFPKSGDRVGSKTWTKYCINKKIPLFWRNFVPVIVRGDDIIKYFY